jgi:hypothetical protein
MLFCTTIDGAAQKKEFYTPGTIAGRFRFSACLLKVASIYSYFLVDMLA